MPLFESLTEVGQVLTGLFWVPYAVSYLIFPEISLMLSMLVQISLKRSDIGVNNWMESLATIITVCVIYLKVFKSLKSVKLGRDVLHRTLSDSEQYHDEAVDSNML